MSAEAHSLKGMRVDAEVPTTFFFFFITLEPRVE